MKWTDKPWVLAPLAVLAALVLQGCDEAPMEQTTSEPKAKSLVIHHNLGTTEISSTPERVAVLDMNEADFLDQLEVPIAGMVKDYVPHFLAAYGADSDVQDLGAITQPNLERIYALKPDLILMTPIQAAQYDDLSELAPTLHFDVDFRDSHGDHIGDVTEHLLLLGKLFDKEKLAESKAEELKAKVEAVHQVTEGRPETALIVMHNNGSFSSFGTRSRYGFVFDSLGVKPASRIADNSLHGQPVSSEFIHQANPDILYIIDRTAVMERRPVMRADQMSNPLLRETKAWKNGNVVFVDADAWYITAASVTSLELLMDDVIKGYRSSPSG
ncbi:siderophore ABC transporter substrate-binding protein [Marinobacterium mangrovicola]|uniref:Iron complex transport system substrate-binding protein n=1 Tax=Marinobacterium mangrovicola TaxID=1476959 RepID=A0A4R1GL85_9GAMM|nr:siderophore ABC transporter substrate-binding protein [Marinobacterium mangrovicola]TCK09277.1 iron complex transport system substrate-binding protein [Marinobacterium mangrovicola]